MAKVQKYKMDKSLYLDYIKAGILFNMEEPKWGANKSAIIQGSGKSGKSTIKVEVEVLGYYLHR